MPTILYDSLHTARSLLSSLQTSIRNTPLVSFTFVAPIIDRLQVDGWRGDDVRGLKKFIESVDMCAAVIDTVSLISPVPNSPIHHHAHHYPLSHSPHVLTDVWMSTRFVEKLTSRLTDR